ncbi:MAG TPA: hypothetical protein VK699_05475 [Terriglobales bacterium]|jgi:hypothetical protein|nr:hypothetical protein [Terriglobales bacterium]
MQTADLVLAILVPVVTLAAGWAGVEMSLTPPDRMTSGRRLIYRGAFIVFMLAAIALNIWQTTRNAHQQDLAKNDLETQTREFQQKQQEMSNKVSEQGGKLDAITHFEQQFLTFAAQQHSGSPDAQTKAYEAMALAVMKTAQGPGATSDAHVQILNDNHDLNGQTIFVNVPNAAQPVAFTLPQFRLHNSGGHASGSLSARLYLSKQCGSISNWQQTPSDEQNFPVAFFLGPGFPATIVNPQETWNLEPFGGTIHEKWDTDEIISAKLKLFYGATQPAEAHFFIRRAKP